MPSTIQFASVLLKEAITRLGGNKGLASTDTAKFSVGAGNTIEFDPTTQLVTIGKGDEFLVLPVCNVRQFEPLRTPKG